MQSHLIRRYLFVGMIALAILPLISSYWILDEIISGVIRSSMTPQTRQLLIDYQRDLKVLKELDPAHDGAYKARFIKAHEASSVFDNPELYERVIKDTYKSYYLLLLAIVLLCAIGVSWFINRQVIRAYRTLVSSDVKKAETIMELQHFEQWQQVAKKLAHEINNPLTPIEIMVSALEKSFDQQSSERFKQTLLQTKSVVKEEVNRLKQMVTHFNQFSKLPSAVLQSLNLFSFLKEFVAKYQSGWPELGIEVKADILVQREFVAADPLLLKQCILNIISNAIQANLSKEGLLIEICLTQVNSQSLVLTIVNNGKAIPFNEQVRLFSMYFTSGNHPENMGIGLNVVQKILSEHHASIECLPLTKGAGFKIIFPIEEKL
jgi:signal transduction histidine kinase